MNTLILSSLCLVYGLLGKIIAEHILGIDLVHMLLPCAFFQRICMEPLLVTD